MSDRPDGACLTHRPPKAGQSWRRADSGYRTCSSCYDQLHRWLSTISVDDDGRPDGIPGLCAMLDARPGRGESARRGPGFGSRSPASDHIVVMADRRSKSCRVARDAVEYVWDPSADNGYPPLPPGVYGPERPPGAWVDKRDVWRGGDGRAYSEQADPVLSVPGILTSWVQAVWEDRYEDAALDRPDYFQRRRELPAIVDDAARWLDQQLDWLTRQEIVTDFWNELRELHSQLRAATGGGRQPPVGHCIELLETGECGAPIYMPKGEQPRAPDEPIKDLPELRCPACDSRYTGRRLIVLRLTAERQSA